MASNSQGRSLVGFGKRLVNQIRARTSRDPSPSPSLSLRRAVNVSVYDKNVEDQVRPTMVPEDVIGSQPDKYWTPDPQTGVFGPAKLHNPGEGRASSSNGGEDSVMEQKAFFRPLEDLEKPIEDSEKPPQL
ncbi:J domain-containing protein [Actinidia chinensis var. chinensis]|uniref:J domain-containing protein n=1 Tax=Actinidia chinensis var. chinensis TaxID=1590841 RepID=A0A2R6RQH9_ACTCC|nr:J domain-containing protein [Actinidia chinensis var. chinensis]